MEQRHAICLSGSGTKLGFQLGAVKTILREFKVTPEYIVGNSGGGFAAVACAYATPEEAIRRLLDIKFFGEMFHVDLQGAGFINVKPMRAMVENVIGDERMNRPPHTPCTVALFNYTDGMTCYAHSNDQLSCPDAGNGTRAVRFKDIWFATGAVPFLMAPVADPITGKFDWADGGVRDNVPLREAVRQGADVIWLVTPWNVSKMMVKWKPYWPKFIAYGLRGLDGMFHECMVNDLAVLLRGNDERGSRAVEVRLIEPIGTPLEGGLFEVKNEIFQHDVARGEKEALQWKSLKCIGDAAAAFPDVKAFQG